MILFFWGDRLRELILSDHLLEIENRKIPSIHMVMFFPTNLSAFIEQILDLYNPLSERDSELDSELYQFLHPIMIKCLFFSIQKNIFFKNIFHSFPSPSLHPIFFTSSPPSRLHLLISIATGIHFTCVKEEIERSHETRGKEEVCWLGREDSYNFPNAHCLKHENFPCECYRVFFQYFYVETLSFVICPIRDVCQDR